MTTPPNPEDEPVRDDLADDPDGRGDGSDRQEVADDSATGSSGAGDDSPSGGAAPDRLSAQDAAWRSIVENYGDRPTIEEPPAPPRTPVRLPADDSPRDRVPPDPEEHFVPPAPPPLTTPPPARLLAWLGLFGVPTFVLVALVMGLDLPSWLGLILMVWFVGGFVFLVASMGPGSGRDYDDGARL